MTITQNSVTIDVTLNVTPSSNGNFSIYEWQFSSENTDLLSYSGNQFSLNASGEYVITFQFSTNPSSNPYELIYVNLDPAGAATAQITQVDFDRSTPGGSIILTDINGTNPDGTYDNNLTGNIPICLTFISRAVGGPSQAVASPQQQLVNYTSP